jgi:hypothetical protein
MIGEGEQVAIDWVRRNRPVSSTCDIVVPVNVKRAVWAAGLETVRLADLERKGYVERWREPEGWRWTATDQPPSFKRPHWRAEMRDAEPMPSMVRGVVFANVGDHPECFGQYYMERRLVDAPGYIAVQIEATIASMQHSIAEDDCGCGKACNQ